MKVTISNMNNLMLRIYIIASIIDKSSQNICKRFSHMEQQCICVPYDDNCESPYPIQLSNDPIVKTHDGKVDVMLQNVKLCEKKKYVAKLQIYEEIVSYNECQKSNPYLPWIQTHSGIQLVKCQSCSNISENITIKFNYVFTGCYVLTIVEDDRLLIFRSEPKLISTNFPKDLNGTSFELLFKPIPIRNETKIEIKFNSINMTRRSIYTSVNKKMCKRNCMALNSTTEIAFDSSLGYIENFTRCSQMETIEWKCSYNRDSQSYLTYSCFYYNLKPGRYNFYVKLIDEYTRCNRDSIWSSKNLCNGYCIFDVLNYTTQEESYPIEQHESQTFIYVISCTIISFIILIILINYIYHKLWQKKGRLSVLPPNEILIIYARDAPLFTQMINKFKKILLSINDTVVYDIMDEKDLLLDKTSIINNAMANNNVKIILFVNKCSLILKNSNYSYEYIRPNCQDALFGYVIQQLERRDPQHLANNFIIGVEKQHLNEFHNFNIKRRYLMPYKILKLLKKVFNENTKFEKQLLIDFESKCQEYNYFNTEQPCYYQNILQRIELN